MHDAPIVKVTKEIYALTDRLTEAPPDICGALVWATCDFVLNRQAMSKESFLEAVSHTWDAVQAKKATRASKA